MKITNVSQHRDAAGIKYETCHVEEDGRTCLTVRRYGSDEWLLFNNLLPDDLMKELEAAYQA